MSKKVAVVKFPNTDRYSSSYNKKYNFLTTVDNLQAGDTVVVDTVNGLQIANFVKYDDLGLGNTGVKTPHRWLIQKVELDEHNRRIEAVAKLEKLKVMMEVERKKAQELEIYEILAKQNPDMAVLLDEFKQLQEVL